MNLNESELVDKLNKGIVNRPKGTSPEEAAKEMLPKLSENENATLVAIATDTLVKASQVQKNPNGNFRHG